MSVVSLFGVALSTARHQGQTFQLPYHPRRSQTEQVNQILEQYLRVYINYQQDNWVNLLPLLNFAYNNTSHSATMVTPFFANKGFNPKLEVPLNLWCRILLTGCDRSPGASSVSSRPYLVP